MKIKITERLCVHVEYRGGGVWVEVVLVKIITTSSYIHGAFVNVVCMAVLCTEVWCMWCCGMPCDSATCFVCSYSIWQCSFSHPNDILHSFHMFYIV